ncbi:MAG: S41 family peptidase [Clostridiales bacterium]|nr:S41 family peptidase [Clostridiales bacterium]
MNRLIRLNNRLLAFLLAALLVLGPLGAYASWLDSAKGAMVTIPKEEYERLQRFALLDEVMQYVDAYFYEEPVEQDMIDGAIQGLLSGLGDAYTFYYDQKAWTRMQEEDTGKYAGIGVQMLGDPEDGSVTITRVFKNTPAERVGIKKGDVFYKVEELEVTTATMMDAVDIMRGIPGEKVHIELVRNGEILPFDLVKANITVNRAEHKMIDDKVGYIILFEFSGGSQEAFTEAYEELKASGMQYLIVDLRDNPGGWVGDAEGISELFLDNKLLYYTEDRAKRRKEYVTKSGADDLPMLLLVNEHSASASEILAGGMQDNQRAIIMGEKTFGKGIIQFVVPLSDGVSGFQFTSAQYFSPLGHKVHKEGITPDIEVVMPEELRDVMFETGDLSDPQLTAAYQLALEKLK